MIEEVELFLVYQSGNLAVLNDVTESQCARFVENNPYIHIFMTVNGET